MTEVKISNGAYLKLKTNTGGIEKKRIPPKSVINLRFLDRRMVGR